MQARSLFATCLMWLVAAALAGLFGPARAQVIKPLDVEQDAHGLDYFSGQVATPLPTLSIPAAPNLVFQRVQDLQPVLVGRLIPETWGRASYDINVGGQKSEAVRM